MSLMELRPEEFSDEEVLSRSITEPSLFALIVSRYEDALLRKAERILRNREDAEDAVQEAFTRIYLAAPRFKEVPGANFRSWAYKITVNACLTLYAKRKKGQALPLDEEAHEFIADPRADISEELGLRDYVASVLARMPENLARSLELQFLEDKGQGEAAKEEGITLGAMKTRVHRAKKEFKEIAEKL